MIDQDCSGLIDQNCSGMIDQDCFGLSDQDCSGLIDQDCSGMIDQDCFGLSDQDCSGMIDQDCSGMIDQDCSGMIDQDCSGLIDQNCSGMTDQDCFGLSDQDCSGMIDQDCSGLIDHDGFGLIDQEYLVSRLEAHVAQCLEVPCLALEVNGSISRSWLTKPSIPPGSRSFWVLLSALVLFEAWIIFLTYYLSRITGPIVSFLLNRYLRFTKTPGHIKLTSFSISLLGGKLMFKDFLYANDDYSIRVNDAWVVFSYWRFVPGRKVCFTSNVSRLHFSLNGVQIHLYNRLQRYKEIAKLFRMEKIFGDEADVKKTMPIDSAAPSAYWDRIWSLVGVIKLDIWSGRVVVGNKLLPYMLVVSLENMNSKIRLSESAADRALLSVEGQAESVRAAFLKHPDYTGEPYKDPPRTMGDGFAILQSALLHFFYHQDILGYVTVDEQSLATQRPIWESILRFDHNTVISYGPWAEHQRVLLYSFFFPSDYQTLVPDELPKRGKRRIYLMHDVRISLLKETSIDIWFMKNDQLESVHSRCRPGSTIDLSVWWIVKEDGFSWNMHISLLELECTSSLPYRKLLGAETFTVKADFHYPRVFNAKQTWNFKFHLTKCCCWLVWDHKKFISDLIDEFLGDATPDLISFIPYTMSFDFDIADSFEGVFLLNESNWVDPAEKNPENVEAALVGNHFNISFTMSFEDFLPEFNSTTYTLRMENGIALRLRYPALSAMAPIMAALFQGAHINAYCTPSIYGTHSKNEEWHEIWRTESIDCVIKYSYHPTISKVVSDLPFHVLQEFLPKSVTHPKDLPPDKMDVTLEIGGSEVKFTGALVKCIIGFKDNYFGLYDSMTDVTQPEEPSIMRSVYNRVPEGAPVEAYRPMEVTFDMRVFNIRAHCLIYTSFSEQEELCPVFYTEEIALQIKKGYKETLIQIGVTPCAAYFTRASAAHIDGYLTLSGLQFRGHAMFSPVDCPWDMSVVEYCWLTEILIGEIGGCFGSPLQIITLINFLDTLLLLLTAKDEAKKVPERFKFCQHGQNNKVCTIGSRPGRPCESEERLKYCQMRISVDGIQLSLADESSAITAMVDPVRFTLCNAHEKRFVEHICVRVPNVKFRQLFQCSDNSTWIECARASIAGISLDIELPLPPDSSRLEVLRLKFLKKHDNETRRLHFLWNPTTVWGCACYGNTAFMAMDDSVGQFFLSHCKKLCVQSISSDSSKQPGVFQDILHAEKKLFREEFRQYYTPTTRGTSIHSQSTNVTSEVPSVETASFHSAVSKNLVIEKCMLSVRPLIDAYSGYLDQYHIAKSSCETPQFASPGEIARCVQSRVFKFIQVQEGIADVHLTYLQRREGSPKVHIAGSDDIASYEMTHENPNQDVPLKSLNSVLVFNGSVASTVEIFFTPLAFELLDRLMLNVSRCMSSIHPSMLVQMCYRECVCRQHKQPLTESLFVIGKPEPLLNLSVDLPRVHVSMFECSLLHSDAPGKIEAASNMAVLLLQKSSITSKSLPEFDGTTFELNSSVLSAQLLHFTPLVVTDFGVSRVSFNASVEWGKSALASRMLDMEPRVVVDFQIPDFEVTFERRIVTSKILNVQATGSVGEVNTRPVVKVIEHKAKMEIGAVNTMVVMPRPLEMTGRNEFPLYNVLSPCLTTWSHVLEKLFFTIEEFCVNWDAIVDMRFAQVFKMALDCTDDRIFNAGIGRSVMLKVKELGAHQAGCPSCLLLHTVLRWCALPSSTEKLAAVPYVSTALNPQFLDKTKRKTALMALLSHWHTDICQQVKLVSNAEARKYRIDPGSIRRALRLPVKNFEKHNEMKHHRNASLASRNLTLDGTSLDQRTSSANVQKVDLYTWMLSVHRERKERKTGDLLSKDYLNPMDIIPQAFFYSFYMSRRLDWTNLDGLPLDQLLLSYAVVVSNVVINMIEQRVVCSAADVSQKFITPHTHQMVHVKKVTVDGNLSWKIEMDEKGLLPVRGVADLTYKSHVENVRFVVALCSVCLIKEIALVLKTCFDSSQEIKRRQSFPLSRPEQSPASIQSNATMHSRTSASWADRVLDMMHDFEKNRSRSSGKKRGDVHTTIHGEVEIDSIRLESILTDLYVSLMVQLAEVVQHYNSAPKSNTLRSGVESAVHKSRPPSDMVDVKISVVKKAILSSTNTFLPEDRASPSNY
ncbi:hypothetical protein KIN20_009564 [Parelaphostrongylus tenuis]|uniref:Bridge-like lipid transfer protein family member 1 N-terminal domain-containing protein n=1 Tax=Parelaphostrongylus tenuis TaxID=148309 RepID=A0AAD5MXX8_PARTN|nr:hypothetical protein KIN20_009564 [Parelaphostrongylus tenuis]